MMDIMIDLETCGTRPGCVVLSIGAVGFSRQGTIHGMFYEEIKIVDSMERFDLHQEKGTMEWWSHQSEAARAIFTEERQLKAKILEEVVDQFRFWYGDMERKAGPIKGIWAQGQDFDFPIWAYATRETGREVPWAEQFWLTRDCRTVTDVLEFDRGKVQNHGTQHKALDDAIYQTKCLVTALGELHMLRNPL